MCSSNSIWLKKKQKQKKRLGWARVSRPEPHIFAGGDTLERPRICSRNQPFKQSTSLETFKQNVTKEVGGGQRIPDGLVFCFFYSFFYILFCFSLTSEENCVCQRDKGLSAGTSTLGEFGGWGVLLSQHMQKVVIYPKQGCAQFPWLHVKLKEGQ